MKEHDQNIYNLEIKAALSQFQSSPDGLSQVEASARLKKYGRNELTSKSVSWLKKIYEPFANAFVLLLLFAIGISIYEQEVAEAIIIGIVVVINALIFYFQQYSVSRVLKSLKDADVAYVHVVRDGKAVRIPGEELTYGDIVHIEEGVKVPADGRLIEANQIQADEALLTGESLPVHKQAGAIDGIREVYDQKNMLFKGTYVKGGTGLLMVSAIGNYTQLGSINELANDADQGKSPIERKIDDFTKKLILAVIAIAIVALLLSIYRGIILDEALKFALVIAVSAVPEGLPVALTIVLLLSARRMARVNALVKKIASIETMGAITLIATDKTGTITQNKLSVVDKQTTHGSPRIFDEVVRASLNIDEGDDHAADSLDKILFGSVEHIRMPESWRKVKDLPFNQSLRLSGVVWEHANGYVLYVKGAPEQVISHCKAHHNTPTVNESLRAFTSNGYRTIGFAHKVFSEIPHALEADILADSDFDGIVGLSDELRPNIKDAVEQAHRAGIKVVMLTGDHMATAGHIAKQVSIADSDNQVAESGILETGGPEDIREALKTTRVFGRVLPQHKYALLKATKDYEITAMTGDGVNDIPALVEADTGLAMGSGTDAAKDASDIVLLDNNFHTIVNAIRIGRTALANIRKMIVYLLGTTAGAVATLLLALILGLPLPVVAIQILWINLVTDGVTVIPLGLSPEESKHMNMPPRHPKAPLLDNRLVSRIITMGVVMSITVLTIFWLHLDKGLAYAQTLAFLSLIVIQWANAFNVNFEFHSVFRNVAKPNWKLVAAIGGSIVLNAIVFTTPLGRFLHVTSVAWQDAALVIAVSTVVMFIAVDLHKIVSRRIFKVQTA